MRKTPVNASSVWTCSAPASAICCSQDLSGGATKCTIQKPGSSPAGVAARSASGGCGASLAGRYASGPSSRTSASGEVETETSCERKVSTWDRNSVVLGKSVDLGG